MFRRLRNLADSIRTSFWFIPALMCLAAAGLSALMLWVDINYPLAFASEIHWLARRGADGARGLLTAIATSMITVAGTVFSITIVALTLASQQLGPRILRTFMRDRGNQLVLGTFTATFLYALLVLRTVDAGGDGAPAFVPHYSTLVAVALAVCSLGVLVFFIHHVSVKIQAPRVIADIAAEFQQEIDTLFPGDLGGRPPDHGRDPRDDVPEDFERAAQPVPSPGAGYIRLVEERPLLRLATRHDLIIRVLRRPGAFVAQGQALCLVYARPRGARHKGSGAERGPIGSGDHHGHNESGDEHAPGALPRRLLSRIHGCFHLGRARTSLQDVLFPIGQIVEVALRALSPGINDPQTAATCVDWLGACLRSAAARPEPAPFRYDHAGALRIIAEPVRFQELLATAFEPIRRHGAAHPLVAARLLAALESLAECVRLDGHRRALADEAARIRADLARAPHGDPQAEEEDRLARGVLGAIRQGRERPRIDPSNGPRGLGLA